MTNHGCLQVGAEEQDSVRFKRQIIVHAVPMQRSCVRANASNTFIHWPRQARLLLCINSSIRESHKRFIQAHSGGIADRSQGPHASGHVQKARLKHCREVCRKIPEHLHISRSRRRCSQSESAFIRPNNPILFDQFHCGRESRTRVHSRAVSALRLSLRFAASGCAWRRKPHPPPPHKPKINIKNTQQATWAVVGVEYSRTQGKRVVCTS